MQKFILLLFIFTLGLASCKKDDPKPEPVPNEQTVLMYLPWSTNLTSYFKQNIKDFETAIADGILKNERVLVFFMETSTAGTLVELKYAKKQIVRDTLKKYENPAFTTAGGITSILNDVKHFAEAPRYGMIIGCHGLGWVPAGSAVARTMGAEDREKHYWEYDDGPMTRWFGGLSAQFQTDITTLAQGIAGAGIRMEYILFDDCYMSCIEVAYDLRGVADYLIASPTEVMAYGFPYHIIGRHLVGEVDYAGIAEGFYSFYKNYSDPYGTIAVTKCSEVDGLAEIMREINHSFTFDGSQVNTIQRMDGYRNVVFFDYGDYVEKLCEDPSLLERFERQLERTVPPAWSFHTDYYYAGGMGRIPINTFTGIAVSDPSANTSVATAKTETAWYRATHEGL